MPSSTTQRRAPAQCARNASAISASVPPSPLLSARSRISTYLSVTTTISAQKISERTPRTASRVTGAAGGGRDDRFAKRVERAGTDVAVDDADAADGEGEEAGVRARVTVPGDGQLAPVRSRSDVRHGV